MPRSYQLDYSTLKPSVFNREQRERKARTIVSVCSDYTGEQSLSTLTLLDVGSSSGIIDNFLAQHFERVYGIDIDEKAMQHAQVEFSRPNLHFMAGDAMRLDFSDDSVDVVVCSHVYEHVPDAQRLFDEIFRVLKPGGFCYFSGNNRVMLIEPHYKLPFLSLLPRPLAHAYLRLLGRGRFYHEKHLSYSQLKHLCQRFDLTDYSARIIANPAKYQVDYMLKPGSIRQRLALFVANHLKWATPHIWILGKSSDHSQEDGFASEH